MKKVLFIPILVCAFSQLSAAEEKSFQGLQKTMDAETYEKAGLSKLTSDERAALDEFIKNYVASKQKAAAEVAATEAVEHAVKERKVRPPEITESKIIGIFKGYNPKTRFQLTNGQTWKPTNDEIVQHIAVESPNVVIYRDMFGYKMFVEGMIVRVKKVQ